MLVSESAWKKEKDIVSKEIEKLRVSIQTLCKSALPLGKIMDYIQEDVDAMQNELQLWHSENKQHAEALQEEQRSAGARGQGRGVSHLPRAPGGMGSLHLCPGPGGPLPCRRNRGQWGHGAGEGGPTSAQGRGDISQETTTLPKSGVFCIHTATCTCL